MRQSQSPTPPGPPVNVPPFQAGPQSGTLVAQLTDLRVQEAGLIAQQAGLKHQLDGMLRSNPARPQVQAKHAEVGMQLAQVQGDIARIQAQLQRQGVYVGSTPPLSRARQFNPDLAAGLMFAMIFAVLMPIAIAHARRIWRGRPVSPAASDPSIAPRLDRLEQAIDAVAIEVERVSEGQRFVTKILAERPMTAPGAAPPAAAPAASAANDAGHGDYGAAMRALGAGAAEPLAMPERETLRQRNTPR